MFKVQVIPLTRRRGVEELTYFSALEYPVGSVLKVPMRNKQQQSIVVCSEPVKNAKASLKQNAFVLHKIERQSASALFSEELVRAAQRTADHYATSVGSVLSQYLPKVLLNLETLPLLPLAGPRPRLRGFIVPRLYQGLAKSRTEFYRTAIREAFASKGSVLLIAPTIAEVERLHLELATGIEQYVFKLHSGISERKQQQILTVLFQTAHPIVLVATSAFLSLPRHDLTTIIVEREGSSLYRSRTNPPTDARVLAHYLAEELGGQLFLADLPLRIESVYRKQLGEYEEIVTGNQRMHFPTRARLVSLKGESRPPKRAFRTIGRDLITRIHDTHTSGGRTFLYVARRGLSPVTVCGDCGMVVACRECGASVVLHAGSSENYFLCHACGAMRHARERCVECQSWRLETFGVGTELVASELHERIPEPAVHVLSSDTARTHSQAQKIVDAFYADPKTILVGTELALPYLRKHVPLVGVVSLDSLLSLASWNIYERIANTLTRLRDVAGEEMLLQTRHPDTALLEQVIAGNFSAYYRNELRQRKMFGYPPYTVLIKVSVAGAQNAVHGLMQQAQALLHPFELIAYEHPFKAPKGVYVLHGFVRVARETWPDHELLLRLRALSPNYAVTVDPESIL